MNKNSKKIFGVILIVTVILIVAFFSLGGQEPIPTEVDVVTSDDGKVELSIPKGSLPEGVTLDDIQIIPDETSESAYSLEPDGLEFKYPVNVKISSPLVMEEDGFYVPLLIHSSDDFIEVVDETVIVPDTENKVVSISGDITHFCRIEVDAKGTFYFALKPMFIIKNEGESFKMNFTITPPKKKYLYEITRFGLVEYSREEGYMVNRDGKQHVLKMSFFTPKSLIFPDKKLKSDETYQVKQDFTCKKNGKDYFEVENDFSIFFTVIDTKYNYYEKGEHLVNKLPLKTTVKLHKLFGYFSCRAGMCTVKPVSHVDGVGVSFVCEEDIEREIKDGKIKQHTDGSYQYIK